MPYLPESLRDALRHTMEPTTPGELHYCIQVLVDTFLSYQPTKNYEAFNAAVGALDSAKMEFYRRMVTPYEDSKIKENGDLRELDWGLPLTS